MNRETRYQSINRKRNIPQNQINSSIEVQPKQRRTNHDLAKMSTNSDNIRDLSGSINVNSINNNAVNTIQGPSTSDANAAIATEVREVVVDETLVVQRALEESVKKMVQDEVSDLRKSIGELTKMVKEISVGGSRTQESNYFQQMSNNIGEWNRNSTYPSENRLTGQNRSIGFVSGSVGPTPIINNTANGNNLPNSGLRAENMHPVVENRTTPNSSSASGSLNRNSEKISIHVDKWGLVFNGNNTHMSVEDFIFRIEHLQAHYNISWDEILRDFHLLVTGPAKDWYWLLICTHGVMPWPAFRRELLNQYKTSISNFEIMRDLVERKQQPNETLDAFFHNMNKLRSRLIQHIPEYDMIKILKRNVKESVARIVYPIAVASVEQLRIECIEAERNFPRRETKNFSSQQRPIRAINEMYLQEEDEAEMPSEQLAAIKISQQKPLIKCWNCKVQGHGFRDCDATERALFCYRCGKPDVIAPKCPDCKQGNRMRDVGVTGDRRPSRNQI